MTERRRARPAGADLLPVGLVRRRPLRWVAMTSAGRSIGGRCLRCRLVVLARGGPWRAQPRRTSAAAASAALPDRRQLPRVPQRADHALGRGRVDRRRVARLDDGQLRARSLLAGVRPARDDRSPDEEGGDRGRVLDLPHADGRAPTRGPPAGSGRSSRTCPSTRRVGRRARLAADGVSCTLCHQIGAERLGTPRASLAASS